MKVSEEQFERDLRLEAALLVLLIRKNRTVSKMVPAWGSAEWVTEMEHSLARLNIMLAGFDIDRGEK